MLAALETLLVSLYSPGSGSPAEVPPVTVEDAYSCPLSLGNCRGNADVEDSLMEHSVTVDKAPFGYSDGSPSRVVAGDQTENTSSSSSSEDWIVNLNPGDFDLAFPQLEDYMASTGTGTTNPGTAKGLERLDNHDQCQDKGKDVEQLSAVSWSRGTALTDPSTGEPLQPVKVHLATGWSSDLGQVKAKGQSSPGKKVSNAITEKRAALTAYDLINNRAMKTPLSPAALFERETRASVLQEKPTATLQDISTAVQEKWKNLGEEDRKKWVSRLHFRSSCFHLLLLARQKKERLTCHLHV